MRRFGLILAAVLGLAASAVPASADITWTLTQGGSVGPTPGVFGTITATQLGSGSTASVQVTVTLAPGNLFVTTGAHSGITWDLSTVPTGVTVTSSNASLFTVQPLNGSYGNSPFGSFQYAISWNGNGAGSATESSIVFDITKTGGLTLTNNLFTANANNNFWGVDIGYQCTRSNGSTSCNATGVVAALPEPGTWTLAMAGLMGLAGLATLQRRRKSIRVV